VPMAKYVPSPRDWVREQVELYENSGGTKGTTLRDTGSTAAGFAVFQQGAEVAIGVTLLARADEVIE